MRIFCIAVVALLLPACLPAQQGATAQPGMPDAGRLAAVPVRDTAMAAILTGVVVEGQGATAAGLGARVLTLPGGHAGLDCGCMLTRVFITVGDEERSAVFDLGELLNPELTSIDVAGPVPVIHIAYGWPADLRRIRVEARVDGLRIAPDR